MANKPEENVVETKTLEVLQKMQEQLTAQSERMQAQEAELAELRKQAAQNRQVQDEPEIVSTERKPASEMLLAVIDGKPITDMRLVKKTKINDAGQTVVSGLEATCKVHGKDKEVKITCGDMDNPTDYLNLQRRKFYMVDQIEESGASKIDRAQVIRTDGLVDEKKEVNNVLVPTGRKVQLAVREDFRYYTIDVDGEKVTLPQDKIYR